MIKLTFCLTRLPHLTREAFQHYWLNTHGPLVRDRAEILGIRRYVQTHTLPDAAFAALTASRGSVPAYDGVAELWWDSLEAMARGDEAARQAAAELLEDERKFIDLARSPLWLAQEHEIVAR